ncbi:hypothetical protein FraQA3DRAFT_0577 [Frankia sp. QA3]|nr:hypothetical protein FraQA3DRAFT_0577 [Frankia sp. QA3]
MVLRLFRRGGSAWLPVGGRAGGRGSPIEKVELSFELLAPVLVAGARRLTCLDLLGRGFGAVDLGGSHCGALAEDGNVVMHSPGADISPLMQPGDRNSFPGAEEPFPSPP